MGDLGKLIYIKWVDACAMGGYWEDKDYVKQAKLKDCQAVGFVYAEDNDCIILVQCDSQDLILNELCIPQNAIKERRVIPI